MKHFGNIIRSKRLELYLTQIELASISRLHVNYISDIENGRRNPSLNSMKKLCESLGLKIALIDQKKKATYI